MKPGNNNNYDKIFNREYFEGGAAPSYELYLSPERRLRSKEFAKNIKRLFNPEKVLEIGCAKGFLVEELRKLGIEAYGVDVSRYAISHAPDNVKPYLQVITPPKLPFKDKSFDLVCSVDVLEHIPEEDLDVIISEYYRVGKRQYHHITTKTIMGDRDVTHVTIKPLSWWRKKLPGATLVETKWYLFMIRRALVRFLEIFIISAVVGMVFNKSFLTVVMAFIIGMLAALARLIKELIKPCLVPKNPAG